VAPALGVSVGRPLLSGFDVPAASHFDRMECEGMAESIAGWNDIFILFLILQKDATSRGRILAFVVIDFQVCNRSGWSLRDGASGMGGRS
jgi:hypothetical protein